MTSYDPPSGGPDKEFGAFYREHVPRLVGFLMLQGAKLEEAADVAQETMTRAFRLWSEIREPRAWTRMVAQRELRRREGSPEVPTDGITEGSILVRASADVSAWEARHDLMNAIVSLPKRQREVIAWALDEFTPAETADALRIDSAAVRSNLWKARQTLRRVLRQWEDDQ